ncbi:hypothetical protein HAX54_031318, partial [Datura stramonium]|nr:hypothetical protein [Datura stramonium]
EKNTRLLDLAWLLSTSLTTSCTMDSTIRGLSHGNWTLNDITVQLSTRFPMTHGLTPRLVE